VTAVDRPDSGQDEGPVLVARCENYREDLDQPCTSTLRYRCGMIQAACDTCGGYCGVAVARWTEVASRRAVADDQRERVARWLAEMYGGVEYAEEQQLMPGSHWLQMADELFQRVPSLLARPADVPPCPSTLTVTEDGITAVHHCLAGPGHEQHANQGRTW
jgi:hypothetical protein